MPGKRFRVQGTVAQGSRRADRRRHRLHDHLRRRHHPGPLPGRAGRHLQGGPARRGRGPHGHRRHLRRRPDAGEAHRAVPGRRTPAGSPTGRRERRPRHRRGEPRPRRVAARDHHRRHRPRAPPAATSCAWAASTSASCCSARVLAFVAMERALITRDFSLAYVAEVGGRGHARRCSTSPPCGARSRARSCCGRSCWPATSSPSPATSARRLDDPLVGWALVTLFVICGFFFLLMFGPANPFKQVAGADPDSTGPGPTRCCRTTS